MSANTLFLSWQDHLESRLWFPIGRLDADVECSEYRFRYTHGVERAHEKAGFPPMLDFPELERDYHSNDLFPLFTNRVMALGRPDRLEYLRSLGLEQDASPFEILSVSGGHRVTDSFQVFPKIQKGKDGSFRCRFFLHGWRYVNSDAQKRIESLEAGERLYVTLELTNPATGLAVQIHTEDYYVIGWAPRYLVEELTHAVVDSPETYVAHVVQINPLPAPSRQRLLIELSGKWSKHEPMSGPDFMPLVGEDDNRQ